LALLYFHVRRWKEAEQVYMKALNCYYEVYGKVHPSTAQVLYNAGSFYREKGDLNEALDYFQQSLDIFKEVLGLDDPKTLKTSTALAEVQQRISNKRTDEDELDDLLKSLGNK